jgi:hypothetical protein
MYPVLLTLPSTIRHTAHNDMNVTLMSLHGLLQIRGVSGCGMCPGLTGSVHG